MCGNVLHCALYVADYKSGGSCLGIGAKQIEGEEEGKIFWVALGSVVGQEEEGGMGQGGGGRGDEVGACDNGQSWGGGGGREGKWKNLGRLWP
jgi:hypothetical protein